MMLPKLLGLFLGLVVLSACQTPSQSNTVQPIVLNQIAASTPTPTPTSTPTPAPAPNTPPKDSKNAAPFQTTHPMATGSLQHPDLSEVSGLASSTRQNNTLWAINDSGNKAKLYAMNHTGKSLGSFSVSTKNRDWEDMASAWINGESYLLVGDIGDNRRNKAEHVIHIFIEPLLDGTPVEPLNPVHTLRFRYPENSHDAESLAYADGWIYVLTKEPLRNGKRRASQVFRLPLNLENQRTLLVAEKVSNLAIPPNSMEASVIASISGVDVSQPTAFDIDDKNRYAYVLTYRSVYRYQREAGQSWANALAQPRQRVHTHSLAQAEALAVSANGVVWITSEKLPAPLWALPGGPD